MRPPAQGLLLGPAEERFGAAAPESDRAVEAAGDDGVGTQIDERGLPPRVLLQPQSLQSAGALGGQPVAQTELERVPLLFLAAVDRHDAEGLALGAKRRGQDGREGRLAGGLEQRNVGTQRCVGQGSRPVLRHDHRGKAVLQGPRRKVGAVPSQSRLGPQRQSFTLLLEHGNGRSCRTEHLQRGDADVADHRLLVDGHTGRIEEPLEQLLPAGQLCVERLNLFRLRLEFLVLVGKLLRLLRKFFRLLGEFLVESRQFVQLLPLGAGDRFGPAGAAEPLGEDRQKQVRAGEDAEGQSVVGPLDAKTPVGRDEPIVGRQRREQGGENAGPAAGDRRHQEDGRVERKKKGQLAERTCQPLARPGGGGYRDDRKTVTNGDGRPLAVRRASGRRGTAQRHPVHHRDGRNSQYAERQGHP